MNYSRRIQFQFPLVVAPLSRYLALARYNAISRIPDALLEAIPDSTDCLWNCEFNHGEGKRRLSEECKSAITVEEDLRSGVGVEVGDPSRSQTCGDLAASSIFVGQRRQRQCAVDNDAFAQGGGDQPEGFGEGREDVLLHCRTEWSEEYFFANQ